MLTAYVTSFAAIVLSFVVHVHATVSATVPISFPCVAYQPSTEHGVTHSHPRFMVVGALSLMFVVSALALRRAVSASAWAPALASIQAQVVAGVWRGALYVYTSGQQPVPSAGNSFLDSRICLGEEHVQPLYFKFDVHVLYIVHPEYINFTFYEPAR
ncbi:hypothetical protein C8F04DRAFT_1259033 [Mycena alexandri]|uniref:Uncharacterized protein n=1 Tax=Mycena alexandri TaxID=1745969 RepID=A0AAD6SX87_9AGAR|nr:hypothetical protein C8F04DRAFT_1259033 [Mycena alexandri]